MRGTSHLNLNLFTSRRSFDNRDVLPARINRCILEVVSSLDKGKPIPNPSGDGQPKAPHTTTRISKIIDRGHLARHFLPRSRVKALFAVSHFTGTIWDTKLSLHGSSSFGWRVQRTMSTTASLSAYLLDQKTRFLGDNGNGWTMVMGNEAGGTPSPQSRSLLPSR